MAVIEMDRWISFLSCILKKKRIEEQELAYGIFP